MLLVGWIKLEGKKKGKGESIEGVLDLARCLGRLVDG